MEPDRIAELAALVRVQEAARQDADRRIAVLVAAAVREFHDWYSSEAITSWTRALVSRVEPIQRVFARSTDAYLARAATITSGRPVRPVGAVDVSKLRAGISHAGAYGRVADTYRYQESRLKQPATKPKDLVPAQQAAESRAQAIASTDVLLVPRAQAQASMEKQQKIIGYRRVIHPELSAGGVCGLCVAASDRLYYVSELMPIHENCKCIPMAVYLGADPGSTMNQEGLALYEDAGGSTSAAALKRTRYKVVQHSELGPTLVRVDAKVRTAADIARDERS